MTSKLDGHSAARPTVPAPRDAERLSTWKAKRARKRDQRAKATMTTRKTRLPADVPPTWGERYLQDRDEHADSDAALFKKLASFDAVTGSESYTVQNVLETAVDTPVTCSSVEQFQHHQSLARVKRVVDAEKAAADEARKIEKKTCPHCENVRPDVKENRKVTGLWRTARGAAGDVNTHHGNVTITACDGCLADAERHAAKLAEQMGTGPAIINELLSRPGVRGVWEPPSA